MKKLLASLLVLAALGIVLIYVLIPSTITISLSRGVYGNSKALYRNLSEETEWLKWWPQPEAGASKRVINGHTYRVADKKLSSLEIGISGEGLSSMSSLIFIDNKTDSARVDWVMSIPTSSNPIDRIRSYLHAKEMKKEMRSVLNAAADYYSEVKNMYHYDIRLTSIEDSTLVSTFTTTTKYPDNGIIYGLIDELKDYIKRQSAAETGNPMLNISTTDSIHYLTRVAIPTNKILPASGNISYKWMLGGGNILIVEVKGGDDVITDAYRQVTNYISDFNRISPAISFLSLVTDRRLQPDSSKWVTRIYYPLI